MIWNSRPCGSREPVFPSYRGAATSFHCRLGLIQGDALPRLPHVDGASTDADRLLLVNSQNYPAALIRIVRPIRRAHAPILMRRRAEGWE
jgi:hypothetical protein